MPCWLVSCLIFFVVGVNLRPQYNWKKDKKTGGADEPDEDQARRNAEWLRDKLIETRRPTPGAMRSARLAANLQTFGNGENIIRHTRPGREFYENYIIEGTNNFGGMNYNAPWRVIVETFRDSGMPTGRWCMIRHSMEEPFDNRFDKFSGWRNFDDAAATTNRPTTSTTRKWKYCKSIYCWSNCC